MIMIDRFFTDSFTLETVTSGLTTLSSPGQTNSVSLTFAENNIGVRLDGFTTGSGTVTLDGSTVESLTFPNNGELITLNTFSSISTISLINLTNESTVGTIEVFLSSNAGAPILFRAVQGTHKGRISNRKRDFTSDFSGVEVKTSPILFTLYSVPASVKDYIRVVGRTFEIISINYPSDIYGNINHQEIELGELSGT
jgi:hypothetical protein